MHRDLQRLVAEAKEEKLLFQEVMRTIREHYECLPVTFRTGEGSDRPTANAAGSNSGSCLLLAFARRLGLDQATTLALWGEHYRDVLADPQGQGHANIRAFMANGWAGVVLEGDPLRLRGPG